MKPYANELMNTQMNNEAYTVKTPSKSDLLIRPMA